MARSVLAKKYSFRPVTGFVMIVTQQQMNSWERDEKGTRMLELSRTAVRGITQYSHLWTRCVHQTLPVPLLKLAVWSNWHLSYDGSIAPALAQGLIYPTYRAALVNPAIDVPAQNLALAWLIAKQMQGAEGPIPVNPRRWGETHGAFKRENLITLKIVARLLIPDAVFRESWSLAQLRDICQVPDWVVFGRLIGSDPADRARYLTAEPSEWQVLRHLPSYPS